VLFAPILNPLFGLFPLPFHIGGGGLVFQEVMHLIAAGYGMPQTVLYKFLGAGLPVACGC
jgi:hypothetical protein